MGGGRKYYKIEDLIKLLRWGRGIMVEGTGVVRNESNDVIWWNVTGKNRQEVSKITKKICVLIVLLCTIEYAVLAIH